MKIVEYDALIDDEEMKSELTIEVDGEEAAYFVEGEPEDANMLRDFSDVHNICNLMKMAYNAGKTGEEFDHQIKNKRRE